jgi:hypothetical protein
VNGGASRYDASVFPGPSTTSISPTTTSATWCRCAQSGMARVVAAHRSHRPGTARQADFRFHENGFAYGVLAQRMPGPGYSGFE